MKLHLECERTIHFQKVDGTQGVLKEGAQAYMHFITSKKIDIWMRATVLEHRGEVGTPVTDGRVGHLNIHHGTQNQCDIAERVLAQVEHAQGR